MQRKGERQTMTGKEYCRYIRTYSELEGLQRAPPGGGRGEPMIAPATCGSSSCEVM